MNIFLHCNVRVALYRYYNPITMWLDFDALIEDINTFADGSVFLFHACAHNPTGIDPTPEQMAVIVDVCKKKNHICILDSAYQGAFLLLPNKF